MPTLADVGPAQSSQRALSLPARVAGVVFSPRATYSAVVARPRWCGVLAFVIIVGAAGTFAFLSTEVGRTALLDQQVRTMESFGVKMTDATYDRLEVRVNNSRVIGPIFQVLGGIDLFILWWTISLAIGLGVLYHKRTAPIASTLIVIYIAIGVIVAAIKSMVSGA
jgi:hypothetical protein